MTTLRTIVLALIQGITEFLPISSSAHLILAPVVLGWPDQGLHFDIAVNTGTLLAVIAYFRRDLVALVSEMLRGLSGGPRRWFGTEASFESRLGWLLAFATIPVGACGLLFYDWIGTAARNPRILATTSIVFGVLLFIADRFAGGDPGTGHGEEGAAEDSGAGGRRCRPLESLSWQDALFVGLAQALALIPGTSRSGVTMTAGLFARFDRVAATRFAFLLAIPVGVLAAGKDALEMLQAPPPVSELTQIALGLGVAAVAAYLAIGWLLAWVRRQDLTLFVVYRILLGCAIFWLAG